MESLGLPPPVADALTAFIAALLGWLVAWLRTRQLARDQRETVSDTLALDRRVRRLEGVEGAQMRKRDRDTDEELLSQALETMRQARASASAPASARPGLVRGRES